MENPLHILETGSLVSGRGCKTILQDGVFQSKSHSLLLSSTKFNFTGNENAGILSEIGLPILSSTDSVTQDGVLFEHHKASTTLPADRDNECENSDDVDAEKVDEWLKGKSGNSNSVIYEYDFEMKATQEDLFPGNRSLLEEVNLGLTDKDQLVSVAELLGTQLVSKKPSSKPKTRPTKKTQKKEKKSPITFSKPKRKAALVSKPEPMASSDLQAKLLSVVNQTSPYVLDPSQLDLVETNGPTEPQGDVESAILELQKAMQIQNGAPNAIDLQNEVVEVQEGTIEFHENPTSTIELENESGNLIAIDDNGTIEVQDAQSAISLPLDLCQMGENVDSALHSQEENLTTVSIHPDSDGFVLISVKSLNNEQIFRVKSSAALDPNQALTLENLISQPLFLSPDGVCTLTAENESEPTEMPEPIQELTEGATESVEVDPWLPSVMAQVGGKRKVFHCPVENCDGRFAKETKLRVHILNHERDRPHKCTFLDCDWSFNSEYRLKRHLISHVGKKNYTCSECGHQFTTKYNLRSHEILHKRPNNVFCPRPGCDRAFSTRRKMELHLKEHQEMEAPYKCHLPNCGKSFYSANFLSSHLRVHQYSKEDLSCPIEGCGRVFVRICQLRSHMRQHTGERPYVCNYMGCGWKFSSASKLTRHMRKHTGERKYTCTEPGCRKSFMRPEHLKGHVIVHSGDRPFVCKVPNCGACFTAKSSLYVHMKRHTGDSAKAVFPCPIAACTKKYNFKAHLRLHMLKVHASVLEGNPDLDAVAQASLDMSDEDELEASGLDAIDQENLQADYITTESDINVQSLRGNFIHITKTSPMVDIPQLMLPETLGQTLPSDLLTLSSENGQLTLTSSQLLVNPADLLVSTESEQAAHSLLADMDQLLMEVDCGQAVPSPAAEDSVVASCPLDPVSGVLGGPAIEVADGGSARTDYSSNLILSSRAKRRRHLQQQFRQQELAASKLVEESLQESGILSAADVVLASSAISLRDSEMAPALLPVSPLPYYMDV